ncbi:hypothetical protein Rsub_05201 [Raphidocelis subcapitata]|uniref:NECAP PHear domain-containing protein n=1 Tax=Raphidocelis subcapitata TaxID=307507 RepID=A0A2V0P5X9_9CHLO|nr:hypothetical protein Rsub_05201 [Raphidocelis subcapitata]|eukprot:GBF92587.1 hypothetical protein Rsub_05201 [Raphidocelis subcapitata]
MDDPDLVYETLFVHRAVHVYKIPSRPDAGGHLSGQWRIADRMMTGRLRAVACGERVELRLEEGDTGELFAMCPYTFGSREVAVEPVADSSRYFVIRVEDPVTGRHAFLGLGFDERGDAFDFSAALADHERRARRERGAAAASAAAAAGGGGGAAAAAAVGARGDADAAAAAALYKHEDLSLKEGQTIRVGLKLGGASARGGGGASSSGGGGGGGGGFMSRAAAMPLGPLAPPPAGGAAQASRMLPPPPPPGGGSGNPFWDAGEGGTGEGAAGSGQQR